MKVALVHDYLREYGGAERVVETLHEMWPEAPLYTSFVDWTSMGDHAKRFRGWDIRTSWVQNFPFVKRWISPLRFLAPKIWESLNLSEYDVVISSSGWFMCRGVALQKQKETGDRGLEEMISAQVAVKNLDSAIGAQVARPNSGVLRSLASARAPTAANSNLSDLPAPQKVLPLHICYIHHPPRNLYGYATGSDLQKYWIVRVYAAIVNFFLRQYDFDTAQAVDYFIANSHETASRVEKFYRRNSVVVYPPIDIHSISNTQYPISKKSKKTYFLSVGRLTYAKRVDLAILACNTLKLPLKIVGKGKEQEYLRSIAGPTVEFLGGVSDEELEKLYANARALIFSALDEDFGMVPVEAMAHGTPVVALAQGGVKETVVDGETGVLFGEATVESLMGALGRFGKLGGLGRHLDKQCKKQAEKFSKERFKKELKEYVNDMYNEVQIEARVEARV